MDGLRLFVVQIVMVREEKWFAPGTGGPPIRSERHHYLEATLFAAPDADTAYLIANESLRGYSDANHDGPGELTEYFALGLHQLEELTERLGDLKEAVQRPYGVGVGLFYLADVDAHGVPLIRSREQLEVFARSTQADRSDQPSE